jgi:hypothetical protein
LLLCAERGEFLILDGIDRSDDVPHAPERPRPHVLRVQRQLVARRIVRMPPGVGESSPNLCQRRRRNILDSQRTSGL